MTFIVGVDLGQAHDWTAVAVVERLQRPRPPLSLEDATKARGTLPRPDYHLRYLERPALGTLYPVIVDQVVSLLHTSPLSPSVPLVVDSTGVGRAVVDMFATQGGVRPRAVTITGGTAVTSDGAYTVGVPKRDLVGTLVAIYQSGRFKAAEGLALVPALTTELINFKLKINLETGHDSYEAWRESIHDDLVLAVALACWWGENRPPPPPPVVPRLLTRSASPWRTRGDGEERPALATGATIGSGPRVGPTWNDDDDG